MKKIVSLILVCIFVLVLASCGCEKEETAIEPVTVTLYFPNDNLEFAAEERLVSGENIEKLVVEEVIKGPTVTGLSKSIQGDVKVLSAATKDGVCTIDLSKEFADKNTGGSAAESIAIYSIVNSLCTLEGVNEVKINIEGDTDYEFGGHFYMGDTFEFERNMIRIEDRPE